MLIHSSCGQKVVLDLSESLVFCSGFGYGKSGLVVNLVNMMQVGTGGTSRFACPVCKVQVPIENLVVVCCQCARPTPASEAVIPKEAGGVLCKTCGDRFYPGDTRKLTLTTYTIGKDAIR